MDSRRFESFSDFLRPEYMALTDSCPKESLHDALNFRHAVCSFRLSGLERPGNVEKNTVDSYRGRKGRHEKSGCSSRSSFDLLRPCCRPEVRTAPPR